jgi:hypothetical protein
MDAPRSSASTGVTEHLSAEIACAIAKKEHTLLSRLSEAELEEPRHQQITPEKSAFPAQSGAILA